MSVQNPLSFTLTPGMAPAAPLMRMLGRYDRRKLEAFIEISISLLDMIDGDTDGDEGDAEDAFVLSEAAKRSGCVGAGCPISDAAEEGDGQEDDEPAEDSDSDRCAAGDDCMQGGNLNCSTQMWPGADLECGDEDDEHSAQAPEWSAGEPND